MTTVRSAQHPTDWFLTGRNPALATQMRLVDLIRQGIPWGEFTLAMERLGLSQKEAARVLHLPERTLARRKAGRLDLQEGERFLRLIRLWGAACEVLGTPEQAWHWLEGSNRALGGVAPLSLIDTDLGTQAVEDLLGRIEHGILS